MADPTAEVYEAHPFVYHYTDRAGLEGILSSQTMFATHYRHLNDTSEIEHMRSALIRNFQHCIKAWVRKAHTGDLRQRSFLSTHGGEHIFSYTEAKRIIDPLYDVTFKGGSGGIPFAEPFITSFCTHSDDQHYERENGLLSQWRGYTDVRENGGFALVFDTERLAELAKREGEFYYLSAGTFGDVIYDGDAEGFRSEFANLFGMLKEHFEQIVSAGPKRDVLQLPEFVHGVSRFKHRAFLEEQEVRIIISPWTPKLLKFVKEEEPDCDLPDRKIKEIFLRPGNNKPTTRLFDYRKEVKLPVVKIIVGPHHAQDANCEFAKWCVETAGMDVKIQKSETPYLEQ
jgi:hypothetical protein